MQPYFLPYFGYWQLMAAADRFVIFDDVQYINRGWVNRNRIKFDGRVALLSLKLDGASQNKRISDIDLIADTRWKSKIMRTIEQAYARAPYRDETMGLAQSVILCPERNLADYLLHGLRQVREHLGIAAEIVPTSRIYSNAELGGQARVIDICRREGATSYINAEGGHALYKAVDFAAAGITLCFLTMRPFEYAQGKPPFVSHLSVIDILMWLGRDRSRQRLGDCDIQRAEYGSGG